MSKKHKKKVGKVHSRCVHYVKHRNGGWIHPRDTGYAALVTVLEKDCGIVGDSKHSLKQRCADAALRLGIIGLLPKRIPQASKRTERKDFYRSLLWKKLRYQTLVRYKAICQACGASGKDVPIRVDHIKPVSTHWELRLDPKNVQVLCNDCNWGKLDLDTTDWR